MAGYVAGLDGPLELAYAACCSVVSMAEMALVMAFFAADRKIVCGLAKIRETDTTLAYELLK